MECKQDWDEVIEVMRSLTGCLNDVRKASDRHVIGINEATVSLSIQLAKAAAKLEEPSTESGGPAAAQDVLATGASERSVAGDGSGAPAPEVSFDGVTTPEETLARFAEYIVAEIASYARLSSHVAQQSFVTMQAAITMGIATLYGVEKQEAPDPERG